MSDPIPLGDIRFHDNFIPALHAEDYTLTVTQSVTSADGKLSEAPHAVQAFSVVAPRFALDPGEIQSFFPPDNSSGTYGDKLPHIVLNQRALPWERLLGPGAAATLPWLALLVFAEGELLPPGGVAPMSSLTNPTLTAACTTALLRTPAEANILGPQVDVQVEDEANCRAIDVPVEIFTKVTPRLADLPFLAHVREVNVDAKSSSAAMPGGWFSVVIANRFPATGTDAAGERNIVHLVSLEGFDQYLVDAPSWPSGKTAVRLASLASWSFTARPEGLDFAKLMEGLVAGQAAGGDGLRLRLPLPATAPAPDTVAGQAYTALSQGYGAFAWETRAGDRSFAWCHGALVPHPVPGIAAGTYFASAAVATIYDSQSGVFDLTYAAAWEAGRLLALHDRAYGTAQQRARKAMRKTVNLGRQRGLWSGPQVAIQAEAVGEALAPQQVSSSFARWLTATGGGLLRQGAPATAAMDRFSTPSAPVLGAAVPQLREILTASSAPATLSAQLADQAQDGPVADMVDWLARLRLLEKLPFQYLVPDARMLPPESIRFFYVDPNVLDALCDGAQSIGLQTSRDVLQHQAVRETIASLAGRRAAQLRSAKLGVTAAAAGDAAPADPVAGLLLRSAVVSGWPGLEVKAYADTARTNPIAPLRLDHVAPDVLIALYPQVPVLVDVEEPKEALAFGTEEDRAVGIRSIAGGNIGTQIAQDTLGAPYLRDGQVLAVDAWQKHLIGLAALSPNAAVWGPAAFAMQMVSAPEQMTFEGAAS